MKSGHPWKLNKVVDGKPPKYPFTEIPRPPTGYQWKDISYVIGGYHWKARFMNKDGYIITDWMTTTQAISDTKYLNQFNFANPNVGKEAGWTTYNSGVKQLPYNCGSCHTTGYTPQGKQDQLPGIVGAWAEPGIQCEACHGPGSQHAANPRGVGMKIDRDSEACGKCHRRDAVESVNAKDGFIEHHEQYEEQFQSKHVTIDCVVCHNPHQGVVQLRQAQQPTTRTKCENCHFARGEGAVGRAHGGEARMHRVPHAAHRQDGLGGCGEIHRRHPHASDGDRPRLADLVERRRQDGQLADRPRLRLQALPCAGRQSLGEVRRATQGACQELPRSQVTAMPHSS